jgi:hypothetical protein
MKYLIRLKKVGVVLFYCLIANTSMSQVLSYTVDEITFKWEDFTTYDEATELIALAGEDDVYPLVIPFSFQFFDNAYTEIFASINGNATFGQNYQELDFNRENLCEPKASLYDPSGGQSASNPDNFIAVYWNDLFLDPTCDDRTDDTPKFVYRTIGTTPDREFIISWEYFIYSGQDPCVADVVGFNGYPGGFVSAQMRLKETSNLIEVHIGKNTLDKNLDFSAEPKLEFNPTISVENIDGTYAAYAACGPDGISHEYKAYLFTPSSLPPPVDTTGKSLYCDASGPNCDDSNGIAKAITEISLEGDGTTGFTNTTGCDSYSDYSSEYVSFMTIGSPYILGLTGEGLNPLDFELLDGQVGIYVDWNEDNDFDDVGEIISVGVAINDLTTQTYTAIITPPATATSGLKRLRVRLMINFGEEIARPCGFQGGGEVEDYSIVLGTPPPCVNYDSPADGATNQCQSTLLAWSGDSTLIDGYYVYLGKTGSPLAKVDSIGDRDIQEYLATGLMVSTSYDWKIVPFSTEGQAVFCDTATFTTAANQDPTVQITVDGAGVVTSTVEVCNLVGVDLSGIASQGTFAANINTASWAGETVNLDADNVLDVVFTGDTLNKLYFYTLTIEDDNGCAASHSVALHTNEADAGSIQRNTDYVCDGDSALIHVTGNSGNVIDWEFSPNDTNFVTMSIAGDSIYAGNLLQNTYYRAIVQDALGCTDTTESILLVYQAKPAALVVIQQTDTLYANSNTGNITWFKVGNPDIEVATGAFYVPAREPADYYATETNGLGCVSDASNLLTYDWQVGIGENNGFAASLQIYPNPTNGVLNIKGDLTEDSYLLVFDLTGRELAHVILNKAALNQVSLNQSTGVYFVRVYSENKLVHQQQLIVQ